MFRPKFNLVFKAFLNGTDTSRVYYPSPVAKKFSYIVRVNYLLVVKSYSSVLAYDFHTPVFTIDLVFFALASTASIYNKIS